MKIEQRSYTKAELEKNNYMDFCDILVNGKSRVSAQDDAEPEDNSLGRDLNFVYDIVPLMREAYEAGKNGEEFTYIKSEVDEEDRWG